MKVEHDHLEFHCPCIIQGAQHTLFVGAGHAKKAGRPRSQSNCTNMIDMRLGGERKELNSHTLFCEEMCKRQQTAPKKTRYGIKRMRRLVLYCVVCEWNREKKKKRPAYAVKCAFRYRKVEKFHITCMFSIRVLKAFRFF